MRKSEKRAVSAVVLIAVVGVIVIGLSAGVFAGGTEGSVKEHPLLSTQLSLDSDYPFPVTPQDGRAVTPPSIDLNTCGLPLVTALSGHTEIGVSPGVPACDRVFYSFGNGGTSFIAGESIPLIVEGPG